VNDTILWVIVTKLQQARPFPQLVTNWLGFLFDSYRVGDLNGAREEALGGLLAKSNALKGACIKLMPRSLYPGLFHLAVVELCLNRPATVC
jgi:hypothetical protein